MYKQNGGGAANIEKRYIYGSDQIASLSGPNTYSGSSITALPERLYELRDHLGNTRVVFGHNTPSNNLASGIKAYFNYYAFGSGQVERTYSPLSSLFTYNNKRNVSGNLTGVNAASGLLDYGARWYRSDYGRFLSIDPLAQEFPWQSPYLYAGDNPIYFIDAEGKSGVAYKTDLKNKDGRPIVKVVTNVFIYGAGANEQARVAIETDANKNWNNNGEYFVTMIDGEMYEIQFEFNVKIIDKASVDAKLVEGGYNNLNAENNFFEVRNDVNASITFATETGGNTGVLKSSEVGMESPNHEFNHGYGGEDKDTDAEDNAKSRDNDIAVQSKNSKSPGTRKVTQANITAIFKNFSFNGGNKANVGSARPFLYDKSNRSTQSRQVPDPDKN